MKKSYNQNSISSNIFAIFLGRSMVGLKKQPLKAQCYGSVGSKIIIVIGNVFFSNLRYNNLKR